mmetsp:Transcript_58316/g.150683  ORF Transcript_58316/g.150683 Transcript_58316/m.150683 type:complete len:243 (+) Transcript_58316:620-1348(+)
MVWGAGQELLEAVLVGTRHEVQEEHPLQRRGGSTLQQQVRKLRRPRGDAQIGAERHHRVAQGGKQPPDCNLRLGGGFDLQRVPRDGPHPTLEEEEHAHDEQRCVNFLGDVEGQALLPGADLDVRAGFQDDAMGDHHDDVADAGDTRVADQNAHDRPQERTLENGQWDGLVADQGDSADPEDGKGHVGKLDCASGHQPRHQREHQAHHEPSDSLDLLGGPEAHLAVLHDGGAPAHHELQQAAA